MGDTPLTVGILGTWGSGKTSLMHMVREQIEIQGAITGWFDAWKYDKEQTLWRAFLLTALSTVRKSVDKDKERPTDLDYLETMLYRGIDLDKSGGVTINLPKLAGKVAQGTVQIGLSFLPGGATLGKVIEELQKSGINNLTNTAFDSIEREHTKIHIEQVRFLEQFQEKFQTLVTQYIVQKGKRLVLFLDDLDRCLPEKSIEVLEALKLFVDIPGCVFVLGLDQDVIARGVEIRYHEYLNKNSDEKISLIDGTKYLEKIIQLPFHIPSIERTTLQRFVEKLPVRWPDRECSRVFAEGLGDNPRQIKRTVNTFLLLWNLAKLRKKQLKVQIKPVRLAKVVVLQAISPELYAILKRQPGLLRDLEKYYIEADLLGDRFEADGSDQSMLVGHSKLPENLLRLISGIPAIRYILTMHHSDMHHKNVDDSTFGLLSPFDIQVYFTLANSVENIKISRTETLRSSLEPVMITIPKGRFLMGSTPEQSSWGIKNGLDNVWVKWEQPQHYVEISEYSIGKYPVTNYEYQAFVQERDYRAPEGWRGAEYPTGKDNHPVVNVSWDDAQKYCEWLSAKTGKNYRLPTEAEWEKAARGADGRLYPWGHLYDPGKSNTADSKFGGTTPVGQFSANGGDSPYGCSDMSGNVWEWCYDVFCTYEYQNHIEKMLVDPVSTFHSNYRVLRGGSYDDESRYARCAFRLRLHPSYFARNRGFRIVLSPIKFLSDNRAAGKLVSDNDE